MASDTYPLTLDEALARLLAMIGEPVDMRVMSFEPLGLIANFYGTVISRRDVRHESRHAEGEVIEFFVARGDAGAEFYIDQRSFGGASYVDVDALGGGGALEMRVGSTLVSIDWRADRPAWITGPA